MVARPFFVVLSLACLTAAWVQARSPQGTRTSAGGSSQGIRAVRLEARGVEQQDPRVGETLNFRVAVEGGGGPVSLKLLNPQPGLVFEPALAETPPYECAVRWLIPPSVGERVDLVFQAAWQSVPTGGAGPVQTQSSQLVVPLPILRDAGALVRHGDISGDGIEDVVAVARQADRPEGANFGVAYVWLGGSLPSSEPDATLQVSDGVAGDQLGSAEDPGLQLVDLNGDGVLDVLLAAEQADVGGVVNCGALYAFLGGPLLQGTLDPDVRFLVPSPAPNDRFGSLSARLADLTGDGQPELLAGTTWADRNGMNDVGGFWVWEMGNTLGTELEPAPALELQVPSAESGDRLGESSGESVHFIDLTGDGILDLVIGNALADVGGIPNLGSIHIWEGGASFLQNSAPTVSLDTLSAGNPSAGDQLGRASGQAIQFADFTGDGRLDVIAAASQADAGFLVDSGAVYVFEGRDPLVNMGFPDIELIATNNYPGDALAEGTGETVQFADLSGDGVLDILVSAEYADGGSGRIYYYESQPFLSGEVTPTSVLFGDLNGERLGNVSMQGVFVVDITGDGNLDVVAGSQFADAFPLYDVGRCYVWPGDFGWQSFQGPVFVLEPPFLTFGGERMGFLTGPGMQFFDIDGDTHLDLVTGASLADPLATYDTGAGLVWGGGPFFGSSNVAQLLDYDAVQGDQLGHGTGQGIRVHDFNSDGRLDLIIGAEFADVFGGADAGKFMIWYGTPFFISSSNNPTRDVVLQRNLASPGDRLGSASGMSLLIADLTGDLVDDVIIGSPYADHQGIINCGAYYVWDGLQLFLDETEPMTTLVGTFPQIADQLGRGSTGMLIFDMTGDSLLDLLLLAPFSDRQGLANVGALEFWEGGTDLMFDFEPPPSVTLAPQNAMAGDLLGF